MACTFERLTIPRFYSIAFKKEIRIRGGNSYSMYTGKGLSKSECLHAKGDRDGVVKVRTLNVFR